MGDIMEFPETVEEFMEEYKMVDKHEIYSNGIEYVPIFRMKQWFEHCKARSTNAKRYIDADVARRIIDSPRSKEQMLLVLSQAEPADVVEVVRCKDCKFRKIEFGWNGKRYKMCANTDYPTDDDAYCSYGERREDG